jgi:hypothetical protein
MSNFRTVGWHTEPWIVPVWWRIRPCQTDVAGSHSDRWLATMAGPVAHRTLSRQRHNIGDSHWSLKLSLEQCPIWCSPNRSGYPSSKVSILHPLCVDALVLPDWSSVPAGEVQVSAFSTYVVCCAIQQTKFCKLVQFLFKWIWLVLRVFLWLRQTYLVAI